MFVARQVSAVSDLPLPAQPVDVSKSDHKRPLLNDGCWQSRQPAARLRLPFLTRSGLDGRSPSPEPATSSGGLERPRYGFLNIGEGDETTLSGRFAQNATPQRPRRKTPRAR